MQEILICTRQIQTLNDAPYKHEREKDLAQSNYTSRSHLDHMWDGYGLNKGAQRHGGGAP